MSISRRRFIAGALGAAVAGSDAGAANPRWIDIHMHAIGGRERQFGQAVERAVATMDELGIAKSVVFPPPMPAAGIFDYADYVPRFDEAPFRRQSKPPPVEQPQVSS